MPLKKCSTCHQEKDTMEFYGRAQSKDGLSYSCKDCQKATAARSYSSHKTLHKEKRARKRYYTTNREKLVAAAIERYKKKAEMLRQQSADYRVAHPEVSVRASRLRRQRLAVAIARTQSVPHDRVTRDELIERATFQGAIYCAICHRPIRARTEIQIDHIIPINKGGTDAATNKRVVHKKCNQRRPKDGRDAHQLAPPATLDATVPAEVVPSADRPDLLMDAYIRPLYKQKDRGTVCSLCGAPIVGLATMTTHLNPDGEILVAHEKCLREVRADSV